MFLYRGQPPQQQYGGPQGGWGGGGGGGGGGAGWGGNNYGGPQAGPGFQQPQPQQSGDPNQSKDDFSWCIRCIAEILLKVELNTITLPLSP